MSTTQRRTEDINVTTLFASSNTKGNILASDGTNFSELAIGTNDQILTADSTQTLGVKWADLTFEAGDRFIYNLNSRGFGEPTAYGVIDSTDFSTGGINSVQGSSESSTAGFILPPTYDNTSDITVDISWVSTTNDSGNVQFNVISGAFTSGVSLIQSGSTATTDIVSATGSASDNISYVNTIDISLTRVGGGGAAQIGDLAVISINRDLAQSYGDLIAITSLLIYQ